MACRQAGAVLAACLLLAAPGAVSAQLLSPGRLAAPHGALEGIRNCTSCHQLGRSGVSAERCLACHEALRTRIEEARGYHARLTTENCATCHQDHLGDDFDLMRLDEQSFDHEATGFALEGSHLGVACRRCHEPSRVHDPLVLALETERGSLSRTYLGLTPACAGCHQEESPHRTQFRDRACSDCHDSGVWDDAATFDHADAAFALEGLHVRVPCAACHGADATARYTPVPFGACDDCHTDPHRGAMEGTCASCHGTSGWHSLRAGAVEGAFDHARTSFALRGAHATAECSACHRPGRAPTGELVRMAYRQGTASRTYPLPVAEGCASCHLDRHATPAFARRWLECAACHSEAAWSPGAFGVAAHAASTFPLDGAHVTAPCLACHQDPERSHTHFQIALAAQACVDCHASDDPHTGRFGGLACDTCHGTEAFDLTAYDHAQHPGAPSACVECHAPDDPHGGQFEARACSSCHGTETFTVEAFDHDATGFPLDGAHDDAACASCHGAEPSAGRPMVRYRPLGTGCADCHGALHES